MATNNDIGLAEPSTITHRLATVTQTWNSTVRHQELQSIAGAESTLEIARVQATAPVSTSMGLVVRIASGPSSAADLLARVNQGIGNSSLGDRWMVNTANSSAADYHGIRIVDSSGTGFHGPTNPIPFALTDSSNAVVKPADSANNAVRVNVVAGSAASTTVNVSSLAGTVAISPVSSAAITIRVSSAWAQVAFSTAGHTTLTTVLSSAATRPYVSAFSATSTEAGPIVCGFYAGSTLIFPFTLWSEGGVANVVAGVSPPGHLFAGQADRPLNFNIISGSTGTIYLGVTYRQE